MNEQIEHQSQLHNIFTAFLADFCDKEMCDRRADRHTDGWTNNQRTDRLIVMPKCILNEL